MVINKITTGFVIQVFDTDKKRFISQNFTAGDECEYETKDGTSVDSSSLEVDGKEIYLPYDMVQPGIRYIQLLDLDGQQIGILKTNADESTLDELINSYSEYVSNDKGIDEFLEFCKERFPINIFDRFFLDEERVLEI